MSYYYPYRYDIYEEAEAEVAAAAEAERQAQQPAYVAPTPTPAPPPTSGNPTYPDLANPENLAGIDPSQQRTPIDLEMAKLYREALEAGDNTGGYQQALGFLDPLQHTKGYSNPALAANRVPRPKVAQLPTGAPMGRVKPISKGMNYLQSIMPQGGGQPSSGGSTMMSQALRGGAV